jgi:polyhydroxyalkanoate synthesis repressor PhaR
LQPPSRSKFTDQNVPQQKSGDEPIVIRKYANRRLYNTASSAYVTLDALSEMVREGIDFVVQDARTGEDITRTVLAQIIFDEEGRGGRSPLLPVTFLRQLISFYGDNMQSFVPAYLEMSMQAFSQSQERLREQMSRAFAPGAVMGGAAPGFEDQVRRNMEMFEQAMRVWTPFTPGAQAQSDDDNAGAANAANAAKAATRAASDMQATVATAQAATLDLLQRQMEEMQRQIEALSRKK